MRQKEELLIMKALNGMVFLALVTGILLTNACSSEDPEPVNEEELITTVRLTFTNNGQTDEAIMVEFRDIDGPGGEDPTIDDLQLNANASYTLTVEFLNEQANENITEEIRQEGVDHQVFYVAGGNTSLTYTYGDQDSQGNPIGLSGTLETGSTANGSLSIILIHEPNKNTSGVSTGNLNVAGGEEDIRVQFNVSLQ